MNVKVNDSTFQSVKPLWVFWPFPLQLAGNGMSGIREKAAAHIPTAASHKPRTLGPTRNQQQSGRGGGGKGEVVGNSVVIC